MDQDFLAALRAVVDKQQITELVHAYCQAVDRHDFEKVRALYHGDAIDDHGAFYKGPAMAYIDSLPVISADMEILHHNITTVNIRLDGDYAEGETYGIAFHQARTDNGLVDVIVGTRFLDKFEKRNGKWKFSHRSHALDWATLHEPSAVRLDYPWFSGSKLGKPGADDPSFAFFRLFKHGE